MDSLPETKVCRKCKEEKSTAEHFNKRKAEKDGIDSLCRSCNSIINAEQYAKNAERRRQKGLENYYKNHEHNKDKSRKYARDNIERLSEYNKKWCEDNSEWVKERAKIYAKNNPEIIRQLTRRRRANLNQVQSETYTELDIFDRWGTDCHLCGEPVDLEAPRKVGAEGWERGLHLEHVIPIVAGGPDIIENVKPSHGLCNLRKPKK